MNFGSAQFSVWQQGTIMHVIRAESAGFCLGVSLALRHLDKALEARATTPEQGPEGARPRLITLGPIIHNPLVMDDYARKGVLCLNDLAGIAPGDQVVIRAHGIPREVEGRLKAIGATLVDATCPKVKIAQLAIAKQTRKGGSLLLFGESDHPEVKGLISYAEHDALVFASLEALRGLGLAPDEQYFLAAQTTQDQNIYAAAAEYLKERLGHDLPVLDTICDATRKRQTEVLTLAKSVDAMVVVGGLNSGNTKRLAELAASQGIRAIHVERPEDLDVTLLRGAQTVGLTAGASTPEEHILAMYRFLQSLP